MSAVLEAELAGAVRAATERDHGSGGDVGDDLATRLYRRWYARPVTATQIDRDGAPPLAGALRVSALLAGDWAPATVRQVEPLGAAVVRLLTGGHRVVLPGALTRRPGSPRTGLTLQAGEDVLVAPLNGPVVAAGWWRTWSPPWSPRSAQEVPLTRIYLCAAPGQQVEVVGRTVAALLPLGVPWLLKSALDSSTLTRPDRVVVYLPDAEAGWALARLAEVTSGLLAPHRPPLTAPDAPGVGWAHEQGDGPSFGESRCAALARALEPWLAAGRPGEAIEVCRRGLAAAGIDPEQPHLRTAGATP